METVLIVVFCLGVAAVGAWECAKHRPHRPGRLPEDIQ